MRLFFLNAIAQSRDPANLTGLEHEYGQTFAPGSYLAACVFFGVLFHKSPVGIASELKGLTPVKLEIVTDALTLLVPAEFEGRPSPALNSEA